MRTLVWSASFLRAYKRAIKNNPELRIKIEHTLDLLVKDAFHPQLRSHKLKGELAGAWACTVDYDNRIIFEFMRTQKDQDDEIFLLSLGTHEEVY